MSNLILQGDALEMLKTLPSESHRCCVTSPPYYNLRDYGTAEWVGGDPECDHQGGPWRTNANINTNMGVGTDRKNAERRQFFKHQCEKCGAIRVDQQIGLEDTPEEYVARLVEVFREVYRILTVDGTLWLNLGDTYCSTAPGTMGDNQLKAGTKEATKRARKVRRPELAEGYKPKDLMGMPWEVALALRRDGWYLRQDIIWHKPNCMPESTKDRCTKSHEYIFLLSKSRNYYFDHEAIMEPCVGGDDLPVRGSDGAFGGPQARKRQKGNAKTFRGGGAYTNHQTFDNSAAAERSSRGNTENQSGLRSKRDVWTVAAVPYAGAHFATFPPELVRPCILAGSAEGDRVLDPFFGSGTTGMVANQEGRFCTGIDLRGLYLDMACKRIAENGHKQLEIDMRKMG